MKRLAMLALVAACASQPTEPPTEPEVEFNIRATAIDYSDGVPPDTMAFLLRLDGWQQGDVMTWAVMGSYQTAGVTLRDQLQIAFTYEGEPVLILLAWAVRGELRDSTVVEWTP